MMPEALSEDVVLSVSDFVAVLNTTLEYALESVLIVGELANLRIARGKWVYFDLKDEGASVKFFGTVYQLPGPLEDGMRLRVRGLPRLHAQYGFSVNVLSLAVDGEGQIKRAYDMLKAKLVQEGLFDPERKRPLPYPPERIGLVASSESAAYKDFIKVLGARWGGIEIELVDVMVQGELAHEQVSGAILRLNQMANPPDVLIVTRGGGSAEDMAPFNTEQVVRAVSSSRIPIMVAIGHEVDVCLAELAADARASTPSNAAELLVPDRAEARQVLASSQRELGAAFRARVLAEQKYLTGLSEVLAGRVESIQQFYAAELVRTQKLLDLLNPSEVLRRGYAIVRDRTGKIVRSRKRLRQLESFDIELADGKTLINVK